MASLNLGENTIFCTHLEEAREVVTALKPKIPMKGRGGTILGLVLPAAEDQEEPWHLEEPGGLLQNTCLSGRMFGTKFHNIAPKVILSKSRESVNVNR